MSGWLEFSAALLVFLLSHAIPVRPPVRPWLVRHLGLRGYIAAYSLLSLGLLIWLIAAAARAPYIGVIPPLAGLRWVPLIVMLPVSVLFVAGAGQANPLSLGGMGRRAFDPARPGVLALSRHPLLLAMLLWAVAHLLANGDLAHVILFGLIAGFSGLGMVLIDRRKRRVLGPEAWRQLARNTALFSPRRLGRTHVGAAPLLGGAALFVVLLALHPLLIRVSALP
jgi:uncharacterized membrane protein